MAAKPSKRRSAVGSRVSADQSEQLAEAGDLLIEAYEILVRHVPPSVAVAIATQVIEDLALFGEAQDRPH